MEHLVIRSPSKSKKNTRDELIRIAVGKYYDALDLLKYAGEDFDAISEWKRARAAKFEATMRAAVHEFEETYGSPRRQDGFPPHVWEACHQSENIREFDRARIASLLAT